MIGFTFNGVHSDEHELYIKTIKPPEPPKPRYTNVRVLGKDGEYRFHDGYEDISIEFEVFIKGSIPARRIKRRQIDAWLKGEHNLVMDYDPSATYKVVMTDAKTKEFEVSYEVFTLTFEGKMI